MSVVTSELILSGSTAVTGHSLKTGNRPSREEEFRSALVAYIGEYADYQARRNEARGAAVGVHYITRYSSFGRFTQWLRREVAVRNESSRLTPDAVGSGMKVR
jgi:hypothetical protein